MNEPQKAGFIPPRASVGGEPGAPQGNKSWFSVKASQKPAEAVIDIYDEIGFWGISAQQFKQDLDALGELKNITLHINSPGGNVGDGVAIFNLLRGTGAYITVHIDGIAASMASVIAMVGHKVIMPGNTMMMIHYPSHYLMRTHDESGFLTNSLLSMGNGKMLFALFFYYFSALQQSVYCNVYCKMRFYGWREQVK